MPPAYILPAGSAVSLGVEGEPDPPRWSSLRGGCVIERGCVCAQKGYKATLWATLRGEGGAGRKPAGGDGRCVFLLRGVSLEKWTTVRSLL